ncbi:AMP-binding protein, partial [Shewanella sp. 0m-11]
MSLEQYHVVRLIQQQSQSLGDAIALEGFETAAPWHQVSWTQFDTITSKIARVLIQFGIESHDRAVILSQNCPQWTCADLGLLKAKAVVVPIYPTSTMEQAAYIVNDAAAKLIFVGDAAQYAMACELAAQCDSLTSVVVFDQSVELQDKQNHFYLDELLARELDVAADAELEKRLNDKNLDDLLTLIYTSGTTGDPKGVMLDYRNIASMVRQHDTLLPFTPGDVSLAFLPLSHVFERGWSFYVLCRGGRNVYLS